jgi:hypothetical protein
LSQSINTSLLTSGSETLSYADNCFIFDSVFRLSLLHYIENAQENKKNTILSYNIAENSKRVERNEEEVCVCVCVWMLDDVWLVP